MRNVGTAEPISMEQFMEDLGLTGERTQVVETPATEPQGHDPDGNVFQHCTWAPSLADLR